MSNLFFSSVEEAIQFLADIKKSKILIATEDWYSLPEDDAEMLSQVEALYELEYKYSQLKNKASQWEGAPQRYDNTLKKMGEIILDISSDVADSLLEVFKDWLANHALLSADKWATQRSKGVEDYGEPNYQIEAAKGEYERYNKGNWGKGLAGVVSKNLDEMSDLKNWLEEFGQDEKNHKITNQQEEDGDDYDEDAFEAELEYLDDPEEVWHVLMEFGESEAFNMLPDYTIEDLTYYIYRDLVFPHWLAHWKKEGIEDTRKRVENTAKDIQKVSSKSISDPGKAVSMVNIALNEAHQTGDMMDYVSEKHDISMSDLDSLSNRDVKDWDKELKKMGLKK